MKNKRLCKVWWEGHLPTDLLPDILCSLPVKSLLRLRCVSKSWLSVIDNPGFARLHLENFKNNCDETHLLVVHSRRRNCVVQSSDTFDTNSDTLLTLGHEHRGGSWDIISSIDGLVLLRMVKGIGHFNDLKLWNLSIKKFHEIPSLPKIEPRWYSPLDMDIGLGYDPLTKDYKHVKLIPENRTTLYLVAIYSFGAGSWKLIEFQGKGGLKWRWYMKWYMKKVYFQGSLCFLCKNSEAHTDYEGSVWDLVSFNLSSEVLSSVRTPEDPCFRSLYLEERNSHAIIDGGRSLALFHTYSPDKSVWVLESSSGSLSWTKRYSFQLKFIQFLHLKQNGEILTRRCRKETLTAETGKKSVRCDQVTSYSPETREYKFIQGSRGSFYMISHVSSYVESLILLK